jgi:hypothetical protein
LAAEEVTVLGASEFVRGQSAALHKEIRLRDVVKVRETTFRALARERIDGVAKSTAAVHAVVRSSDLNTAHGTNLNGDHVGIQPVLAPCAGASQLAKHFAGMLFRGTGTLRRHRFSTGTRATIAGAGAEHRNLHANGRLKRHDGKCPGAFQPSK